MFSSKSIRTKLSEEADEQFKELNKIVGEEVATGISSSENQTLLRSVKRAIDIIKQNPFAGTQIRKEQIPTKYLLKYDANNLWKLDLSNYWRMLYTVIGSEIEIISFILDIVDHRTYDKVFGYRKR
ncbi:MAG: hypothetical protein HY362_00100 [Candidatus Aenigmarchaeota archaeon]|nr:hypothetical protein [Candidatus Aenigmarchaeota archaeon]